MKQEIIKIIFVSIGVFIFLIGCDLVNGSVTQTLQVENPTVLEATQVQISSIQTSLPPILISETVMAEPVLMDTPVLPTSAAILPNLTATSSPSCTVLQALNMRPGPGTAYRPPIRSLSPQTILEPLGYEPQGIPGGPWLQAYDRVSNQIGWVSAGSQFIACNIDFTTLPAAAVAPPAPPAPPSTTNSTPDGTFPPNFVWEADFDKGYFVRFKVFDTIANGTKDGDGIQSVSFQVLDADGKEVYQRTERRAGYCIFGGGEPSCNPWLMEDYTFVWKEGGEPIKEGNYKLLIVVSAASGEQGNWNYDVEVKLP